MATSCCHGGARRLSDLLQEQQDEDDPFLQAPQCRRSSPVEACARRLRSKLFPCKTLTRKALALWCGDLGVAGCFPCGGAPRQRFRRLPRAAGDIGLGGDDGRQLQLSPVSVLELRSDDDKQSTSGSGSSPSPPSDHTTTPASTFFVANDGTHAVDGNGNSNKSGGDYNSLAAEEKEQAIVVSGWESIAADISRIPMLVALDLSGGSAREWSWSGEEEEEEAWWRVGQSIEAMIFEEVRWEAVRDMHHLAHLAK